VHETLKRLYYVPIVAAAVSYGVLGGALAALVASLLYLPHVTLEWLPWPLVESHQVGELVLFHVVGLVTGTMADRLRRHRDRLRDTAKALAEANTRLRRSSEERLRLDRLVLLGRVSTGIADSVRNPLAALHGCLEILEGDLAADHPHREFYRLARTELARADNAVAGLLEFANPRTPVAQRWSAGALVDGAAALAGASLGPRITIDPMDVDATTAELSADIEQVRRALLTLLLCDERARSVRLTCRRLQGDVEVLVAITQEKAWACDSSLLLEPFGTTQRSDLSLPTARHLLEMQGGRVAVSHSGDVLAFQVRLPLVPAPQAIPQEV
jgi:C4-dicarboxylate-specific signal transduction histidine kinase